MVFRTARTISILLFLAFFHLATAPCALAEDWEMAGTIEDMARTVLVLRGGKQFELKPGSELFEHDTIRTGPIGSAIIKLVDGTTVEVGPNGILSLVDVTFTPRNARVLLDIGSGLVRVKTGSVGLKNRYGMSITTPKTLVTADNSVLLFSVEEGLETLEVEWMPPGGPQVMVYNVETKERFETSEANVIFSTSDAGSRTNVTKTGW